LEDVPTYDNEKERPSKDEGDGSEFEEYEKVKKKKIESL